MTGKEKGLFRFNSSPRGVVSEGEMKKSYSGFFFALAGEGMT
jgi:hypothetical protein